MLPLLLPSFLILTFILQVESEPGIGAFRVNGTELGVVNGSLLLHTDGTDLQLYCNLQEEDWNACIWYRPNSSQNCAIDSQLQGKKSCISGPDESKWTISKNKNNSCIISVKQTNIRDSGHWSCLLVPSDSTENKTVTVSLLRDTLDTQIYLDRTELNLTQGEETNVTCHVHSKVRSFPTLLWRGAGAGVNTVHNNLSYSQDGIPYWNLTSTVQFTAELYTSSFIQCRVILFDDLDNQDIQQTPQIKVSVNPTPVGPADRRFQDWELGLLVGIPLLLLLILVLIFIFCIWFNSILCFRKKDEKDENGPRVYNLQNDKTLSQDSLGNLQDLKPTIPYLRITPTADNPEKNDGTWNPEKNNGTWSGSYLSTDSESQSTQLSQGPLSFSLPWDPYSGCPDTPAVFSYEGSDRIGSGDLSSLSAGSSENLENLNLGEQFRSLGPPFSRLASLYRSDSSCSESDEPVYKPKPSKRGINNKPSKDIKPRSEQKVRPKPTPTKQGQRQMIQLPESWV